MGLCKTKDELKEDLETAVAQHQVTANLIHYLESEQDLVFSDFAYKAALASLERICDVIAHHGANLQADIENYADNRDPRKERHDNISR